MARYKSSKLLSNASTLDLFKISENRREDSSNLNFVVSDTNEDDLDIVGHPVLVNSIICAVCTQGEASVRINFKSYKLRAGSFVILAPGSMFLCEEDEYSQDFIAYYISFSPDFTKDISLEHMLYDIKSYPYIEMDETEYKHIIEIYNSLKSRFLNFDHPYRKEVLRYSLLTAIYDFSVIYDKYTLIIKEPKPDSYSSRFFELLFKYYKRHRDTGFYSERLNITPKYLSKVIKEETGNSVQAWIFELILFETKSLLRSTSMSIAEIAEHFNYPDSTSFGKFFKKHEKITPLEYRNNEIKK